MQVFKRVVYLPLIFTGEADSQAVANLLDKHFYINDQKVTQLKTGFKHVSRDINM